MKSIDYFLISVSLLFVLSPCSRGQDTVDVNINVEHRVNGISHFDRSKYIIIHDDITGNEWDSKEQMKSFLEDYDVYFGRNNGSIVWEYNNTREDPNKKGWPDITYLKQRGEDNKSSYGSDTFLHQFEDRYHNMMIGGQEHMFPHGQATTIGGLVYDGFAPTAEFYAQYLKYFFGQGGSSGKPKPRMLEVINEPFVKADNLGTTRLELSEYHNVVAQRVKELNPDILVGGYTAAHPMFEASDFNHWKNNWKLFIDVAGQNMDFFSFHLYDYVETTSDMSMQQFRAGSNIEAIMDMINHYSFLKLGQTKPWSISEYGWLCKNCDGGYDPKEDWYNLRSYNNILMQLLERPDQIINAIPFMLLKAEWAKPVDEEYNTYGPRLMREIGEVPGEPDHGGWTYTHLLKFFQFWAEVNGTRIDTWAGDPDIQVDGYVDKNILFLILNNLELTDKEVFIKIKDTKYNPIQNITVKSLYAINDIPQLDTMFYDSNISKVSLAPLGSMILKYEFEEEILINEEENESTYFADRYFQPIVAHAQQNYYIRNVELAEHGEAILRLGLGRDHGQSLKPVILVNGSRINVPDDWRGYDQNTRERFFGVIEIPVPFNYLQKDNHISVTFDDTGGHVTSMALQVFNFTIPIERSEVNVSDKDIFRNECSMSIWPNPATDVINIEGLNDISSVSVFNMKGILVLNSLLHPNSQLNISELPTGIYILKVDGTKQSDSIIFRKQ